MFLISLASVKSALSTTCLLLCHNNITIHHYMSPQNTGLTIINSIFMIGLTIKPFSVVLSRFEILVFKFAPFLAIIDLNCLSAKVAS